MLVEGVERRSSTTADDAVIDHSGAGEDAEERRLPRAVDADDAEPVTAVHGERNPTEHCSICGEGSGVVEFNEHGHGATVVGRRGAT